MNSMKNLLEQNMEKKRLGNTDLFVTPVGMGVLTIGRMQLNLSIEEGAELIKYALARGINFLDTAEYYDTYKYIAKALSETSYEPIISTKSLATDYKGMKNSIETARKQLNKDVLDIFLLHEIRQSPDFTNRRGAWECLQEYKQKGIITAIGISTHHIDATMDASLVEELDVVFTLTNYKSMGIRKGTSFGSKEEMAEAIKCLSDANKGVFTMKTFGGGNLTPDYINALNYVTSLEGVDNVMIGMGRKSDIDNAVDYFNSKLDIDFYPDISEKTMHIEQGDCEACYACIEKCPNKSIHINKAGFAEIDNSTCITCGYCAPVCPVRAIIMY